MADHRYKEGAKYKRLNGGSRSTTNVENGKIYTCLKSDYKMHYIGKDGTKSTSDWHQCWKLVKEEPYKIY